MYFMLIGIIYLIGLLINFISYFEIYFSDEDNDICEILSCIFLLIPFSGSIILIINKIIKNYINKF